LFFGPKTVPAKHVRKHEEREKGERGKKRGGEEPSTGNFLYWVKEIKGTIIHRWSPPQY
jgi:hypothetical protein